MYVYKHVYMYVYIYTRICTLAYKCFSSTKLKDLGLRRLDRCTKLRVRTLIQERARENTYRCNCEAGKKAGVDNRSKKSGPEALLDYGLRRVRPAPPEVALRRVPLFLMPRDQAPPASPRSPTSRKNHDGRFSAVFGLRGPSTGPGAVKRRLRTKNRPEGSCQDIQGPTS